MREKKQLYRKQIIEQLYLNNLLSCTGISNRIGKSIPLTAKMLNELIQEGYVTETGYARSTGGRRPLMYALRDNILFVVSVAIDQYITRIAILDIRNKCVGDTERLELNLSTTENIFPVLAEKIKAVIERSGIEKKKIAGIGIGIQGLMNTTADTHHSSLSFHNEGDLVNYISRSIGLPAFISDKSNLIGLAELRFGSASKRKNVMVINIGWTVGLSLILNQQLFRGTHGYAGEFSHLPLFSNGKLCSCGKTGCLETEASLDIVIQKAIERLKAGEISVLNQNALQQEHPSISCEMIINAARNGDRFAIQLFFEAGYTIGRGLAILTHLLSPELIVLSGKGSLAGKIWEAPIQSALNDHCIPRLSANTEIKISSLGDEAELIGAAALVMENFEKDKRENRLNRKKHMIH